MLDTYVLLWLLKEPSRVSADAREILGSEEHELYLSTVSAWELAMKVALGKLDLGTTDLRHWWLLALETLEARPLTIQPEHALATALLPHVHRDPFDRLLVAQAREARLTLATADPVIQQYEVPLLRC